VVEIQRKILLRAGEDWKLVSALLAGRETQASLVPPAP
jgi:hypothetical protein